MLIKIQVLKNTKEVPAGKYKARYLDAKEYGFLQMFNACKDAQIIEGPQAGEIIRYNSYIELGELPAQADVLEQNEKLLADLTDTGKRISEYARKVGTLQEKNIILEEEKIRHGSVIDVLEKRNRELHEERSMLLQQIERSVDEQKVKLPGDVVKAIENLRSVANFSNFGIIHFIDRTEELKNQFYIDNFDVLRKFTMLDTRKYLGGCEVLLRALVNGYTEDSFRQQNYESPF